MDIYEGHPDNLEGRSDAETGTYTMLDRLGISYRTACHEPAFTMQECEAVEQDLGVGICKNLFLCNRQQTRFYLLMIPSGKVFKTKYLSSQLGCARLSFAPEEKMVELLGIHPGAVSPMGLRNDTAQMVQPVIDHDLLEQEYIGCHPCVNTATLRLRLTDILNVWAPATGHSFKVVELLPE